jgi:MtN3 and saliva related transmembrane protein
MDLTLLGLIAGGLTTISFVPQMIKTWKSRSAKDVSFAMLVTFISGIFLWLIYGFLRQDIAIIAANGVTLIFNFIILGLKIKYKQIPVKTR